MTFSDVSIIFVLTLAVFAALVVLVGLAHEITDHKMLRYSLIFIGGIGLGQVYGYALESLVL